MELRFKQIATTALDGQTVEHLYGLDNDGRIWQYDNETREWIVLSMKANEDVEA